MSTIGELIGQAEALMKVNQIDIGLTGIEETMSITFGNKLNAEFYEEFYSRGLVAPDDMKREYGFTAVAATQANGAVSSGAVTFAVDDGSDFDSTNGAGVFVSGGSWDVFPFGTRSTNTFSSVTNISFDHADNALVYKLYRMPADFGRIRPGRNRGDGVVVSGIPYKQVPENPSSRQFALYESGDYVFLWLPTGVTSGEVQVVYDKKPETLTEADDEVDVPMRDEDYIVYGLIAKWRRILEREADVSYELSVQRNVVERALKKRSAGKRLRAGQQFFRRNRRISYV